MAVPKVIYKGKPKTNSWARWMVARTMKNNNSNLISVVGKTGCLDGKTKLFQDNNSLHELYTSGVRFVNTYSKNKHTLKTIKSKSEIIDSGKKVVYEIVLENGCKVNATANHKFFIRKKNKILEKKLSELSKGNNLLFYSLKLKDTSYRISKLKRLSIKHSIKRIVSIKKVGIKHCYDLYTPIYHNFILSNGILSHNSGKTWSAISICEIMSKLTGVPFGISNIVFDLRELFELINSGKLQRGSCIVCDEFQCSISARDFQQEANKIFNYHLSTGRHRNYSIFFCTPFETMLDRNTRRLFHARFETLGINKNKQTCRLKPRFLEYSDWKTEPYRKQLIVISKDNEQSSGYRAQKLFYWDVPKASQELLDAYEKKKLAFTTRLNKNITTRLNDYEDTGKGITSEHKDKPIERKPLTPTQLKVIKCLANNDYKTSSKILGISTSAIHKNKVLAIKKGYNLEEFKENVK